MRRVKVFYSKNTRETSWYNTDGIPKDYMKNYENILQAVIESTEEIDIFLEKVYDDFQNGKVYVPPKNHRERGIIHSSMMVGDIIEVDDIKYIVDSIGFKKIEEV